ncbi:MAG TPA: MauE/DoxX family redox-associated membrane protein [Candidatus Cybelea sp.]|nr:MauE/DoxX family redox-associated membrane protein [Candidatus Cybelea sp.]
MNAAVFVIRVLLGGTLVAAGALKIGHPASLAASIAAFRLLPPAVVGPLAIALPYFELLLGGYLVAGLFTRVAASVAAVQFFAYAAVIASAVARHIPANCGCFGPGDAAIADWPHVAFDCLCGCAAAFVAYGAPGALAIDAKMRAA